MATSLSAAVVSGAVRNVTHSSGHMMGKETKVCQALREHWLLLAKESFLLQMLAAGWCLGLRGTCSICPGS